MMTEKRKFINPKEEAQIIEAIRTAEKNTSGEIRVHIEDSCEETTQNRVELIFDKLEMHKTAQRNGVLFYLCANKHEFYIYGDKGIHEKVEDDFWEDTVKLMQPHFKKDAFAKGLIEGILSAGNQLKTYFPYLADDKNELPDEISRNQ